MIVSDYYKQFEQRERRRAISKLIIIALVGLIVALGLGVLFLKNVMS